MTRAYELGYAAGLRNRDIGHCPYEGHCEGSLYLQLQWMTGRFDAITKPRVVRRKNLKPRRPYARVRWPRSEYARQRLRELLHVALIPVKQEGAA